MERWYSRLTFSGGGACKGSRVFVCVVDRFLQIQANACACSPDYDLAYIRDYRC